MRATAAPAQSLAHNFFFEATEAAYRIERIEGVIPEWLRGTYYVNGPARFERAGMRYRHWLDGDGMVCALRFEEGGVFFRNRFVETPKLRDERAAGRFLYRGFGTAFPGDRLKRGLMLEPPSNVSAYPFDGRLLAFGEQSLPFDLDPETLETRGEYDFHGKLNEVSPFAAHAKFDGGHLLNFGVQLASEKPVLNVYEFNESGGLLHRKRVPLSLPHSIHDFTFSASHYVFFLSPLLMNFNRFVNEGVSVMDSLSWEPQRGTQLLLVPRSGRTSEAVTVPAGSGYCLHFINAFEDAGNVVVDLLELDEPVYKDYQPLPDVFANVKGCRPVRLVVDLKSRELVGRFPMDYEHTPDFPSIHPSAAGRPYRDFWMLGISEAGEEGPKFFDELAHGIWEAHHIFDIYRCAPGFHLGGEPVFIPSPEEEAEGVILVQHFGPEHNDCEFLLFDARRVSAGPIARLPLLHRIHPGFHSSFSPELRP